MRPVNLIPLEERRGQQAPLRSGPLAYLLVGALVAVLAAVTALVLTGNQISDRKSEIATLEAEDAAAGVEAERLAPYTQFRSLSEQRVLTVASLADSRFDWERVMRELSLVLPREVWLNALTATVAPGVSVGDSGGSGSGAGLRAATPGPALEISGCAVGQESVAGFVTALKDIDGVTRVGVQSSELPDRSTSVADNPSGGDGGGSADDCRTRDFIVKFELVAAFDAAPVSAVGSNAATQPSSATEQAESTASEAEGGG
jgi:Tfp pilus assembly protein PilN